MQHPFSPHPPPHPKKKSKKKIHVKSGLKAGVQLAAENREFLFTFNPLFGSESETQKDQNGCQCLSVSHPRTRYWYDLKLLSNPLTKMNQQEISPFCNIYNWYSPLFDLGYRESQLPGISELLTNYICQKKCTDDVQPLYTFTALSSNITM